MNRLKDTFVLQLETNPKPVVRTDLKPGVWQTPPLGPDYWSFRVPVSENQAVIAFPMMPNIWGISFQFGGTLNWPHTASPSKIYNHIRKNKGDEFIPEERCLNAIGLLKQAIRKAES